MADPTGAKTPDTSPAAVRSLARRWWLNLALLLVIAGLAGLAWYRSTHPSGDNKPPLTQINPDAVRAITLERAGQPATVFERTDDGWRLTAPIKARADGFAVDGLLRLVRAPIDATIQPEDSDLARYGLAPPALTVRLDGNEIRFGELHPLKDERYVQYGNGVYLVANGYYTPAASPYSNYIDARLLEPGRKPVAFKLPGFTLTLKDATWHRKPEIKSLSSDRINAFVDNWRHARALQVLKYGGGKVHEQVSIEFEEPNDKRSTLTIGVLQRTPELVLVRTDEGLEYHFPPDTTSRLFDLDANDAK